MKFASAGGPVRVKICCIATRDEARLAVEAGASALGLVSAMPSGPGVIPEQSIRDIASSAPPGIATFLLTSLTDARGIAEQARRCAANTIQLCDRVPSGTHERLREALPGVAIVQVVHVTGEPSIDEAVAAAPRADAILLDSGNPALAVKSLGGTGRVHDWRVSARIREAVAPVPLFLAGGLRAENVAEAIAAVRPFGVDVCSGVRTAGRLDPEKLAAFVARAASAAGALP